MGVLLRIQRERGSCFPVFHFNFLCVFMLAVCGAWAAPRPLLPPWPEFGRMYHEGFDQPLRFATNQTVDPAVWVESFSGYALQRSGKSVTPWRVPMVVSNTLQIEAEQGAFRLWYQPAASSGSGSGQVATLLELSTSNGKASEVWWALVVSPKGDEVHLVCQTENGPESCLKTTVNWEAGSWHMLTLGFTPTNSALYIDDQLTAVGDGLVSIPKEAAPFTSLAVGSTVAGTLPAQGQMEDLCVFSGRKKMQQILGNVFGLSADWEIATYFASLSKVAALGPISEAEIAARAALAIQRKAEREALALTEDGGGMMRMMVETTPCVTNSPLYITNTVAVLDTNTASWIVTFDIQGTNSPADIFVTTNLLGSHITNSFWVWLERGPSCATYQYTNQVADQSYYMLGSPLDSDFDGLTDAYENLVSRTAWDNPDTDGDGWLDGQELQNGTDPLVADQPFRVMITRPQPSSSIP